MESKKLYYLYQIINLVNNKIYIGVHETFDLNDGYFGSGFALRAAVAKYGKENFKKEVLQYFDSQEAMYQEEGEVVTSEFISRPDVYNLCEGGNRVGITAAERGRITQKEAGLGFCYDPILRKKALEALRQQKVGAAHNPVIRLEMSRRGNAPNAIAKKKETFKQMKFHQGSDNPMSIRCWVYDIKTRETLLILKEELRSYEERGFQKGKASSKIRECPYCHTLFVSKSPNAKVNCCSMTCRVKLAEENKK